MRSNSSDSGDAPQPLQPESLSPTPRQTGEGKDAFPWHLAGAALFVALGVPVLSTWLSDLLHAAQVGVVLYFCDLLVLVIFFGCLWTLYYTRFEESPLALALGALICADWLGIEADHILHHSVPGMILLAVLFVVAYRATNHWRHELEQGRSLNVQLAEDYIKRNPGRPIKVLVLVVSKPTIGYHLEKVNGKSQVVAERPSVPPVQLSGDIVTDIQALNAVRWNWQQTLRAIAPHHQSRIDCLWLLGSEEVYLKEAKDFFSSYIPESARDNVHLAPELDLKNFDDLSDALRFIVLGTKRTDAARAAQRSPKLADFLESKVEPLLKKRYKAHEVVIDVTGGIKVSSIAGAIFTLNNRVLCQYVPTTEGPHKNEDELRPLIYDFRWDKSLVMD
jgi:hypothetical protein